MNTMNNKNGWNITALILSLIPFLTFLPSLFQLRLSESVENIWAALNLISITAAFMLSIANIRREGKTNWISLTAMIISSLLILLATGIVVVALYLNFS